MCGQVITRSFWRSVSTFAVLVIGIIGCSSNDDSNSLIGLERQDETSIIGEWEIQSVNGEEVVRQIGDVRITSYGYEFYEDGRVWWFLFRESDRGGSSSSTIWGTYVINGSKIVVTLMEDDGDDFSFNADFEIEGISLTLKLDTGEVLVLKKSLEE